MGRKLKRILNQPEDRTLNRLRPVCERWSASVHPKVRLADALPIEGSGISDEEYGFALKSHFDFLATDDDHKPLFAVEFDGWRHRQEQRQIERDALKNRLCEEFELPLLRINSNWLSPKYRQIDLVGWFVDVWFIETGFYEAQEEGTIPRDEPFDPHGVLWVDEKSGLHPLWRSADKRVKISLLNKSGDCKDCAPSVFVGQTDHRHYKAIAFLKIDSEFGVSAETGMMYQQFPVAQSYILTDLVVHELYDVLMPVVNGESRPKALAQIEEEVKNFLRNHSLVCAGYSAGGMFPDSEPWDNFFRYE